MIKLLSNILMEKDSKKFNRYELLRKLLVYTGRNNNFVVTEECLVEILNSYISNKKLEKNQGNFLDEIIEFYENLISLYEAGKFGRYNFLVEEYNFNVELTKWLKNSKEEILKFFSFYEENLGLRLLDIIYSNDYFKVIKIEAEANERFLTPYIHPDEIVIRILLDGRIYYKEGLLLEKNQYIIAGPMSFLGGWKILPNKIKLILITIKREFIKTFNLVEVSDVIHTRLSVFQEKLFENLNKEYLEEHPFYLTELVTIFLKINNLLPKEVQSFSTLLNSKADLIKIVDIVNKNIKLVGSEIEKLVLNELEIRRAYLEEIMYTYERTTFQKYVVRKKIDRIVEEYISGNKDIETLLREYKIKNIERFKYNLEKVHILSMRDLSKEK